MSEEEGLPLPKHWCAVQNSTSGHDEMFDTMSEVLYDMGIDCWYDEELAKQEGYSIFITFKAKAEENDNVIRP